jgi:AcrR family transcriptional regulator
MEQPAPVEHGEPSRRPYRSPLRAQRAAETRQALLDAAHRLFVANGWHTTGMRDVAAAAGVATETVYAHFSSKRSLLEAVLDTAVVGDDIELAVAERPGFAAIGRGRRAERCAAAAKVAAGAHRRSAGLARVLREAAATDDDISGVLRDARERLRHDVTAAAALIAGHAIPDTERDGVWALASPEVYLLLVEQSGWSDERYEAWLADTLARLIPRPNSRKDTTR